MARGQTSLLVFILEQIPLPEPSLEMLLIGVISWTSRVRVDIFGIN
jgi:hypothetical protein